MSFRRILQYLWFRGIHSRRIIDYIGATESSEQYAYIREQCENVYEELSGGMPETLKENGFRKIFRNLIIAPLYYQAIYRIFREGRDAVMMQRVTQTMNYPLWRLGFETIFTWLKKCVRDGKVKLSLCLRPIKWNNNGVNIEVIREMVKRTDFNCLIVANKFVKSTKLLPQIVPPFNRNGLNPLVICISDRYSFRQNEGYSVVEIPFQCQFFPVFRKADRELLAMALKWCGNLRVGGSVRRKIRNTIKKNFLEYRYFSAVATEVLKADKARCVIALEENEIEFRILLSEAKKRGIATIFFYSSDGVQHLTYKRYLSEHILVANKIQHRNFIATGVAPGRCHVVGSFNFQLFDRKDAAPAGENKGSIKKILYFTKGTRSIDHSILRELLTKLDSLGYRYEVIIKKHPKDTNPFLEFKCPNVIVTAQAQYEKFVFESDLIISQYSSVIRELIPLRKPLIIYTYSDILEYGEKNYFSRAQLPNYFKYVQNKAEFHRAIEELLSLREPESLPHKLAEDLYGYTDNNCGTRIAEFVGSFIKSRR